MPQNSTTVDGLARPSLAVSWHLEQTESCRDEAAVACRKELGVFGIKCLGWDPEEPGIPAWLLTAAQSLDQTLTNDVLQLLVANGDGAGTDQAWGFEPNLLGDAVQVSPVQGSCQALP